MSRFPLRRTRFALLACACAALAACGSFDIAPGRLLTAVTPYRVEVVQGNFVSKEQVEALKPGMSRQQVKETLGTPLLASVFHSERWDYVFTLKRQGVDPQSRKLTVYFKGNVMDRFEGDEMPSEAEFVATLDKRKAGKVPVLEASEEKLGKFTATPAAADATPAAAAPPAVNYPPLEPPAR
ncbi:MAG: outer membrane protein assembly factor BamE [Burkholderiales bacterium]|nr:outer membrane protein assembly factor BamE [Burkholderiales bacterium]